jgi:hypothetical protein
VDLLLLALGLYLLIALVVASWRRASGAAEAIGAWAGLSALWALAALPRWIDPGDPRSLLWGPAWTLTCLVLAHLGRALGGRTGHERVAWLLGPVHALGLAGLWFTAARRRSRAGRAPAGDRPREVREDLESVVELGETTVGEIMVPRSEIAALEDGARVRDWIDLLARQPHHHVPVYREDLDDIAGCLRIEDLYGRPDPEGPVTGLLREVRFVPESMRCDDLLRELIAAGEHVAMVVDEFGGTAGLVADQDLFEILLGEIAGQDPLSGRVTRTGEQTFLADGHCRIDDLNEWFPVPLPEGDYETLAGLLLDRLGRIPTPG